MIAVYLIGADGQEQALELEGLVEVGREGEGLVVDDPAVSRRHVVLDCQESFILVTDLGSSYGTFIDDRRVEQPTRAHSGSTIRFGDTRIVVAPDSSPAPGTGPQTLAPQIAAEPAAAAPNVAPEGYDVIAGGGVEVRYQPGSAAANVVQGYHKGCTEARKALSGLGSEPWGNTVVVWLVDPFPDPQSGAFVTAGSLVDASRNELWVVVTPEAPPEAPHHGMARLFGDALPASADLDSLLEGYGLHVAGTELTDDALANLMLPPLEHAEGDLRSAMALSFVRYLIDREGEASFRRLLAAPAGQFEATFQDLYGTTSSAVEEGWHRAATMVAPDVKAGEFLRVAVRYLMPYKLKQLEIFVYMLLSLAFIAAFPFATRRLFDTALPSGEFSEVISLLVLLGIAFVVSLVAGLRQAYQSAWVSGAVVRDIRTRMFDRLQGLPEAWH
ncbi:MAG: FHA domain-containing protein, partial [Actinomycetota bacterium]|nr:FHA domain-containing protein [Actinomycetota bacterium]